MISPSVLAGRIAFRSRKPVQDPSPTEPPKFPCPICDAPMAVRSKEAKEWLGLRDTRVHALRCDGCGMVADRIFHPLVGYYPNVVI